MTGQGHGQGHGQGRGQDRAWPLQALLRFLVLGAVFGCMLAAERIAPGYNGPAAPIAALGFLLLAGDLLARLGEHLRLPHLTGYLIAGVVAGPHVLHLIDEHTVEKLQLVNSLALALIAFSAGAELTVEMLRSCLRSLALGTLFQSTLLLLVLAAVFLLARPLMPFLSHQPLKAAIGLSLLWAVVAVVKSPSAILGVLAETGAQGPLTRYAVGMVVLLDVVVLVLFAVALVVARTLIEPGTQLSVGEFLAVGHEIVSSIALGTTLGLVIALYLWQIGKGLILFVVAIGYGTTELAQFLGYDSMLIFAVAGFVVQNLSSQGGKLLSAVEQSGSVVYVVFFANAGAHLDLSALRTLWPLALLFGGARAVVTSLAARFASKLAKDDPVVRRYGWCALISQAGVAIGVAVAIERAFPAIGAGFRSLCIAVIGLNEAIGPVLFKFALERAGETREARAAGETREARAASETREARAAGETREVRAAGETGAARDASETREARDAGDTRAARDAKE